MPVFKAKERRAHCNGVINGTIPVKENSKFSAEEQIAYNKGCKAELDRNARIYAFKNATPLERQAYKDKKSAEAQAYKSAHPEKYSVPSAKQSKRK